MTACSISLPRTGPDLLEVRLRNIIRPPRFYSNGLTYRDGVKITDGGDYPHMLAWPPSGSTMRAGAGARPRRARRDA
jgi:hypothetical protein